MVVTRSPTARECKMQSKTNNQGCLYVCNVELVKNDKDGIGKTETAKQI